MTEPELSAAHVETLSWFEAHKIPAGAGELAAALSLNRGTANQRIMRLLDLGKLDRVGRGLFAIPGTYTEQPATSQLKSKPTRTTMTADHISQLIDFKILERERINAEISSLQTILELLTKDAK